MTDDIHVIPSGRPVRLVPTAPGFWMTVLGAAVAALGPLFGFLIGSMIGVSDDAEAWLQPVYIGILVGVVVGGLGVLMAVLGGRRLWLSSKRRDEVIREDEVVE